MSTQMWLYGMLGLRVIKDPDFAIRYAELLILQRYGQAALDHQRPLAATDEESAWRVNGSPPPLASLDEWPTDKAGQTILINKADGRVLEWHGRMLSSEVAPSSE